ncbi:iron-containing redox enzyme family protein [Pendulispora albinea]|uniref:Iron-containing redox enzyme family protein n=1 Tax=Pendulispora albinea TaxID=2741071 RepID=A0ABZ2M6Z8_9BACT
MTHFERRLREQVDSKYRREPTADNPLWRLVNDRLPIEECRIFYVGLRDSLAVFNRVLLGRLLEESPSEGARSKLLPVISVEFGPPVEAAHPAIFNRFLRALGVSASDTHESSDLLALSSACAPEIAALRKMSWCELLARLLVGETQGPVVFPVILEALRRNYGLRSSDVSYFSIHATHDKKDTEILFDLLATSVKSQADEDAVARIVDTAFDSGRYAVTGCLLEAKPRYRFADYSSSTTRTKGTDWASPVSLVTSASLVSLASLASPAKDDEQDPELDAALERMADDASQAPIRRVLHLLRTTLRQRLSEDSFHVRFTQIGFAREMLERMRRAVHAWEFVMAPRLLQICPDLDARVLVWQAAHASYGSKRTEGPAANLLDDLLSTLGSESSRVQREPVSRSELLQWSLPELIARGLVADNLIALECLPVIRRALLAAPFGPGESDLHGSYFHRALRDAALGLEIGIDLLARYAPAGMADELVVGAFQRALDASPYTALVERAHPPHTWSKLDVTTTTA